MGALLETYAAFPFPLVRAAGDRVWAEDGTVYHDWYGGHCVTLTGHSHPRVVQAIADQAAELLFYSAAARLRVREQAAEALLGFVSGAGVAQVFFCNSGAEANENALKLAIKQTGRSRILAFEGGWHGRTLLALSATDDPGITTPYQALLAPCERIAFGEAALLASIDFREFAAVIVEPIQSMSGIRCASPDWFQELRERSAAAGCWLICDEIQTGMGRIGAPSAAEHFGIRPDAITLAKGLASGVPVGATLLSAERAAAVAAGDLGSTFGGGPLAMAALLATLEVIAAEDLPRRAAHVGARLRHSLVGSAIEAVSGHGLLLGLHCASAAAALALKRHLLDRRILLGGSSDPRVLRLMPCLNISELAIDTLERAVHEFRG